eukprot:4811553-Alexandrium_andersonii.AAC.1
MEGPQEGQHSLRVHRGPHELLKNSIDLHREPVGNRPDEGDQNHAGPNEGVIYQRIERRNTSLA